MLRHLSGLVLSAISITYAQAQPCAPEWSADFPTTGPVGAIVTMRTFQLPDDEAPTLYVAGRFESIGPTNAKSIAKRVGETWVPLGPGLNDQVNDMTVFDDGTGPALYATGQFAMSGSTRVARIAKWDGNAWSPLGTGLNGWAFALAVHDDGTGPHLYVAGLFTLAGGIPANRIARWDGAQWEALGTGLTRPEGESSLVGGYSLLSHQGKLYVGGYFTAAAGVAASNIAAWNGSAFEPLGSGIVGPINDTFVYDLEPPDNGAGGVIAGGRFTRAGGINLSGIAAWDGANWAAVGSPALSVLWIRSLQWFDHDGERRLAAGGRFCSTTCESHVAVLRDGMWEPLADGLESAVNCLHAAPDGLYASGNFDFAGAEYNGGFAVLQGDHWKPVVTGNGMPHQGGSAVYSLGVFDDGTGPSIYAGGGFEAAGTTPASFIARWDGSEWHDVGGGVYNIDFGSNESGVWDMQVFDDGSGSALFVSGLFHGAQGQRVNSIAKWDGKSWSPLGAGAQSKIPDIETFDDGSGPSLYACGYFDVAEGGIRILGRWDGTNWRAVGGPITGQFTHALAVFDDGMGGGPELYVGGRFSSAAGVPVRNVARWSGTRWAACGAGLGVPDDFVWGLKVIDVGDGPRLYAIGGFQQVWRWDGLSWGRIGNLPEYAFSLAAFDDGSGPALYAGCYSWAEYSGQDPHNSIWKLVGSEWQQYLGGTYGDVRALLRIPSPGRNIGESLWLGGSFQSVANNTPFGPGIPSARIARVSGCAACPPDWNADGAVDAVDFFLFLDDFFEENADFDHDSHTNSADLFAFLTAYFTGC